ncbi:sigma-70 family RNA polymerase sigma factor [Photobacterium sp. WH77]|uniref:RNA polymerase sigma factor n=1 Tax=Photobacterium arenosum TaxID=2774143 RepID=A0ABR9BJT7_9GAMM|nr:MULTISPECIES: sigma-70 family RNA polymerase sigma factor [Photobacterium]MBD8511897.1 sigma-70 family RNA polymerase sigma factor [Photobacterium arenosum]MBV7261399.1 sigma-70 family RNA polymerase sigma factor [Photobacterium sp. WH24]MCG2836972.1 sigma-70 family RNA polymerase sigma factor [Photobacterium sp. WH77]MCG2844419.1 sigma-70 family RNA polymerase sigma factor [Photobacterium sp. WH80]MDO6581629.1 sigma-70 family RNA polymerase sigma factor [Photobacterium sp. 2_MG-2023]
MIKQFFRKKNTDASVSVDMNKQTRYEALVRAWHKDLYRYAYWLCHDQHIAEDLVQETCLRAWRSLDSLNDDSAAKAWLITILRRENARRFERKQLDLVDIDDHPIADDHGTDAGGLNESELGQLQHMIKQLPSEYREPLVLQVMAGFNGDEIANILGLNRNTVMTRLFRARNQLKDALEKQTERRGHQNGRS